MKSAFSLAVFLAFTLVAGASHPAAIGSDDGTIVVVADIGNGASFQLYAVDPASPHFVQLTHLSPNPNFPFWTPQFSPDGRRIAFVYQGPSDPGPNSYVMDADGSHLLKLTNDNASGSTAWTSDGMHIILGTFNTKTGLSALTLIPADGSVGGRFITDDLFNNFGGFAAPDGKSIVYESGDGGLVGATWSLATYGGSRHRLTSPVQQLCPAAVSPDSRSVLLYSYCNTNGNSKIWTMDLSGMNLRQLTQGNASIVDLPGAYSPDGGFIAFTSNRHNPNGLDLYVMRKDGSGMRLLASCPGLCFFPTWGRPR